MGWAVLSLYVQMNIVDIFNLFSSCQEEEDEDAATACKLNGIDPYGLENQAILMTML